MNVPSIGNTKADAKLSLFLTVFDHELGDRINDPTTPIVSQFAFSRQQSRARKRARFEGVDNAELTIDRFLSINSSAGNPDITLSADILADASDFIRRSFWGFNTLRFGSIQETLNLPYLLTNWRLGPGASVGFKNTHFVDKIKSPIVTCTAKCLPLLKLLYKVNPHLNSILNSDGVTFKVVEGSKLSTVPKNEDIDRTIATEPLGNMMLQLSAGHYIEEVLRYIGIDISNQQDRNKIMARLGSMFGDFTTIDLQSASDLIRLPLVRLLWPREWYDHFISIRSDRCLVRGEYVDLNMMSTMGNGFTFPMMTLTLLSLIYATIGKSCRVRSVTGRHAIYEPNVAVFGDDIIIPSTEYDRVAHTLSCAGLIINHDKSYSKGPFRESCGGDYYRGVDVTPFYVKTLASDPDVYIAINGLRNWCEKNDTFFPKTFSCLYAMLDGKVLFVPPWEQPYSGVLSSEVDITYYHYELCSWQSHVESSSLSDGQLRLVMYGGYALCLGSDKLVYTRRSNRTSYRLVRTRLPRGMRDGRPLHHVVAEKLARFDTVLRLLVPS